MSVTATTDKDSYPAGAKARLDMRITNTGRDVCSLDSGSKAVELVISDGNKKKVWSSHDCQSNTSSQINDVRPGAFLQASVSWDLTASPATCGGAAGAKVAPGTYTLTAHDGQFASSPRKLRVTQK